MGRIRVPHPLGHLADAQGRGGHQPLGLADAHRVELVVKGLPQVLVEQLAQVPLAHVAVVGHVLEGDALGEVLRDVALGPADQEAVGVLLPRRGRGRLPLRGQAVQHAGHIRQGLVELVHLGGLEEKPGHAQADGPLGVLKIPVPGQNGNLHPGELPLQPGQHGQSVLAGHFDVGKENIRPVGPDGQGP